MGACIGLIDGAMLGLQAGPFAGAGPITGKGAIAGEGTIEGAGSMDGAGPTEGASIGNDSAGAGAMSAKDCCILRPRRARSDSTSAA